MELSEAFYACMKQTLGGDYDAYRKAIEKPPYRGLRVNTLKASAEKLKPLLPFSLDQSPFCSEGFYIDNAILGLGNHPLHACGAFYLQEPSAMSAARVLDPKPGDKVLDLCAAPGGKSTQIAASLMGKGLLWSNEIVSSRAKILLSNLERCGVRNAVVSSMNPEILCERLRGFFDKVLVDAPCSGEGMIRREQNAVSEWSEENRALCARRQKKILSSAATCVAPGGTLVYSTCTLSKEENEAVARWFTDEYAHFELCSINCDFGREAYDMSEARRILPQDGGEGHFIAKWRRVSGGECSALAYTYKEHAEFWTFYDEQFEERFGIPMQIGDRIVLMPEDMPDIRGIKILSAGVLAGRYKPGRFQPEHALYMAMRAENCRQTVSFSEEEARLFLKGHELLISQKKGYLAAVFEGFVLGFVKSSTSALKNHYPKGLRIV